MMPLTVLQQTISCVINLRSRSTLNHSRIMTFLCEDNTSLLTWKLGGKSKKTSQSWWERSCAQGRLISYDATEVGREVNKTVLFSFTSRVSEQPPAVRKSVTLMLVKQLCRKTKRKLLFTIHFFLFTYPSFISSFSSFRHTEKRNNSMWPMSYS